MSAHLRGVLGRGARSLPRRVYRQEYECSFEETDDQVFSFEDVAAAISKDITPLFGSEAGTS